MTFAGINALFVVAVFAIVLVRQFTARPVRPAAFLLIALLVLRGCLPPGPAEPTAAGIAFLVAGLVLSAVVGVWRGVTVPMWRNHAGTVFRRGDGRTAALWGLTVALRFGLAATGVSGVRIVVVDDHPVVRDGLRAMLEGQPDLEVVAEAADGREALARVAEHAPDVVLMDLRMPGLDGADAIAAITRAHPGVHVLVLTTYDEDQDIVRAVAAGAVGYLLKDTPREELFRAVRTASRGESVLAPPVTARLLGRLREPAGEVPSERELEVLGLVAQGLTNRAIGRTLAISEATVKTHLVHVFGKLGVDDRTAAVTTALDRGLLPRRGRKA